MITWRILGVGSCRLLTGRHDEHRPEHRRAECSCVLSIWHDRDEAFLESVAERGNEIGSQALEEELWEQARSMVSKQLNQSKFVQNKDIGHENNQKRTMGM